MKKNPAFRLALCAFFAAMTAILSQLSIPIGPVPINLATFSVFLAGSVLGAASGALSQAVFVLLGAVGVPVFAGFNGGAGALLGPTGGYLIGYIAAAWLTGALGFGAAKRLRLAAAMAAGLLLCYLLGTAWFMVSTGTALWKSLTLCVLPFLPGDALKIAAAAWVTRRVAGANGPPFRE